MPRKPKPAAEAELATLVARLNDPAVIRKARDADEVAMEPIHRRHQELTRRSAAALRRDFRTRRF